MSIKTGFRPVGDKRPRSLQDEHEDALAGSQQAGSYSIVGASVRGQLHQHNNTKRDDAFFVRFDGTSLAVAVADGAGSRSHSRYGASFLANGLCGKLLPTAKRRSRTKADGTAISSELTTPPADNLQHKMFQAFKNVRTDLVRFASHHGVEIDELHSTLLGLLLNTKTGKMAIGQVGDGLILGLDDKREARLIAEPPTTNDPGASYFITQDDWEQYLYVRELQKEEVERFSTLYLMTDGVANDCQYGPPPDILKIWSNDMDREIRLVPSLQVTAERLKNYLSNYKAKGSYDDRTLVVIFKNSEGSGT